MKIFLVRHGQDQDNLNGILNGRRDTSLTSLGEKQANSVADKLRDNNIQVIYSSPLRRAFKTAEIIAKELGISKVIPDEDLIEREFGVLTGKPIAEIPKYSSKTLQTEKVLYFIEAEGSEDFPTVYKRGQKIINKLKQKYTNENILLVTHGDIGKMIRAAYHNWSWKEGLKTSYFANTGVLELTDKEDILE